MKNFIIEIYITFKKKYLNIQKRYFVIEFFILFVFFPLRLFAQFEEYKINEITLEDFAINSFQGDSTNEAIVIFDIGSSKYELDQNIGIIHYRERKIRIKINTKNGYNWARIEIPIYDSYDKVLTLRAKTYNLENEKIITNKLDKNNTYKEKLYKKWEVLKFEMPAVKEGSIIDIEYLIQTRNSYLGTWYFQHKIPTLYSEYQVSIPYYYQYKTLEKGFFPIEQKKRDSHFVDVPFESSYSINRKFMLADYYFKSDTIPAFKSEDFITTDLNFLSSISFEIEKIIVPGRFVEDISSSWEVIGEKLMNEDNFGGAINGAWILKDIIDYIEKYDTTQEQKISDLYEFLKKKITWNKYYGIISTSQLKFWKEGSGSVSDINLLLIAGLKKLGFNSNPVILSTRENGTIHPAQIMLEQYNYVIASVELNDKTILLDATEPNIPWGVLPERCLNGNGRLIDKQGGRWIELHSNYLFKSTNKIMINIESKDKIKGQIYEKLDGYAAIKTRDKLTYYNTHKDFLNDKQKNYNFLNLELDSMVSEKEINKPLEMYYSFESSNWQGSTDSIITINPVRYQAIESNPFKLEKREYPVDFTFLSSSTNYVSVNIPSGFKVEYLPENVKIILKDKKAIFNYITQQNGNIISIISKLDINKVTFLPEEYEELKEFYNQIIGYQSKLIVLKKF